MVGTCAIGSESSGFIKFDKLFDCMMEVMLQNMQPCSESRNILIAFGVVPLLLIIRYVTRTMCRQENVYPLFPPRYLCLIYHV
jgi:hypothetical protein